MIRIIRQEEDYPEGNELVTVACGGDGVFLVNVVMISIINRQCQTNDCKNDNDDDASTVMSSTIFKRSRRTMLSMRKLALFRTSILDHALIKLRNETVSKRRCC
jgi:hypothetical protein